MAGEAAALPEHDRQQDLDAWNGPIGGGEPRPHQLPGRGHGLSQVPLGPSTASQWSKKDRQPMRRTYFVATR